MSKRPFTPLQRTFLRLSPAFLGGFSLPDWIRLLRRNRWQVDREFIPRALVATCGTVCTSFLGLFEKRISLERTSEQESLQPVFILGLERSGTTHLFHLLARDPQFCFPTRFDCCNPHTFLTLRRLGLLRLLGLLRKSKRPMDNVEVGWGSPAEDIVALTILTSAGPRMELVFPRTFVLPRRDVLPPEHGHPAWDVQGSSLDFGPALALFTSKLTFLHGRRPLLKSPEHTMSIPEILRVFPGARFVTILRDPFSQYASFRGMHDSTARSWSALQRPREMTDAMRLDHLCFRLQRYLKTRDQVPPGRLLEIRYRDLIADEAGTLARVYEGMAMTMPAGFRDVPESKYVRNRHPELSPELKDQIRQAFRPFVAAGLFDESELA